MPADTRCPEWRIEALRGLGHVRHTLGSTPEATNCLQQAITIAKEIGWSPRAIIPLFFWLADMFWWQSRFQEAIDLCEEGLALLEDSEESVEAAMLLTRLGTSCGAWGDHTRPRWGECMSPAGRVPPRTPLHPRDRRGVSRSGRLLSGWETERSGRGTAVAPGAEAADGSPP